MATVYGNPNHFRVQQVVATAELSGTKVAVKDATPPKCSSSCVQVPAYDDGKVSLTGSNAICSYIARSNETLVGKTAENKSQVLAWLQLNDTTLTPTFMQWLLPAVSCAPQDKQADAAKAASCSLLRILNDYLLTHTYLVGERITIADVILAVGLKPLYENLLEDGCRKDVVNLTRWFNTILNQPAIKKALGEVKFCVKASSFDGKKFKDNQSRLGGPAASTSVAKEPAKPDQPAGTKKDKKKDKKKEADEPADEMDATELALAQEAPKKDPFADFPKGNWNMDEFKRVYSNEDTEKKALPYFWEKFEKENYSIWYCEYKYADELTLVFMSCNLIAGMFQRLEKMRKNAFGSMCLFGSDNNSTISGVWFWRGQDLAFELSPDWQVDYESYTWTKLNPDDDKTKTLVKEYFMWEGDFDGKKFNQGKIFK